MIVAVLSDIHDNIWKLESVLKRTGQADALIFCGDFCAPFTLAQIAEGFLGPIHVVWGNNDGDKWLLTKHAALGNHITLHGDLAEIDLEGCRIAVNHYPQIARPLAESGAYDAVFYGHDHRPHQERVGNTLLLNPGEVMGRFGNSTFAQYDTEKALGNILEIENH
jgi:putative phosphoesterase